jgi:hypothetical protein
MQPGMATLQDARRVQMNSYTNIHRVHSVCQISKYILKS